MKSLRIQLVFALITPLFGWQMRPASDIPALIKNLQDPDWQVKIDAAKALGELGPVAREAVPALIECLKGPIPIATMAAFSLGLIGPSAEAAAPALMELLKLGGANGKAIKLPAITALGQIGPGARDALPALNALTGDKDDWIASAARRALGEIGDDGKKLMLAASIQALSDPSEQKRWETALQLSALHAAGSGAVPALTKALKDPVPRVRSAAALALSEIGPAARESVPALIEALKDSAPEMRQVALQALGEIGPDAGLAVPALIAVLNAADPVDSLGSERTGAAAALAKIGPAAAAAVPALIEALADSDKYVRLNAAEALARVGEREVIEPALRQLLKDQDVGVRNAVAKILSGGSAEANEHPEEGVEPMVADLPTLLKTLNDGGPAARHAAAGLIKLCRNSTPRIVDNNYVPGPWFKKCAATEFAPPVAALKDPDLLIRRVAAAAAVALGHRAKDALPALIQAAGDSDARVRASAMEALGYIGPDAAPAVMLLKRTVESGDDSERWQAIQALGSIGPAAKPATATLIEVFRDRQQSETIRAQALESLAMIDLHGQETGILIRAAAKNEIGWTRANALSALTKIEHEEAIPALLTAVKDSNDQLAGQIAMELLLGLKLDVSIAQPVFTQALDNEDPVIRARALAGLQALGTGSAPALHRIIELLKDPDQSVQRNAISAVEEFGPEARDAVPSLIEALKRQDMRDIAIESLGKIGPPARDAVPALMEGLRAPQSRTRCLSAEALGAIGEDAKGAVPELVQMLKQKNVWERISAAKGLGGIGLRSEETESALKTAAKDVYAEVRQPAEEALRKIGSSR